MNNLDIILRTCSKPIDGTTVSRICGDNREEMVLKCLTSLVNSINSIDFNISLTILDDHSRVYFLDKVNTVLSRCNKSTSIVSLTNRGNNSSAYQQVLLAKSKKDLVYIVEDDYLHELDAIKNLLTAYSYLSKRFGKIAIYPHDEPLRYEHLREEPTILLFDGIRYWRQITKTTLTILSSANFFKDNFTIFEDLALNYPRVLEDNTINNLYLDLKNLQNKTWAFSPIPSIAYHLSLSSPAKIQTKQLGWEDIWKSTEIGERF